MPAARRRTPAKRPDLDERRRRLDPLIEDQISKFVRPRRHPLGVAAAIARTSRLFMKLLSGRVCGLDRLDRERIKIGRRGEKPYYRRRIVASQSVVDQDAEQIAIVRGLRRDDDRQRGSCAPTAVSSASYKGERGPRTRPSSSWMMKLGDRPKAVVASAGQSPKARAKLAADEHLGRFHDPHGAGQHRVQAHHFCTPS